jgi:ATP-dependent exoDNAse (exonuclease V) beta subunit
MPVPVEKDNEIQFPTVTVVTASAGAGKTYALTHRYAQFLLSDKIPHNNLQSILAITFTNNAAAEMKQRILKLLKLLSLGDEKTTEAMTGLVSLQRDKLRQRAELLIQNIFTHYSDFQIQTIDSFIASIFRSSSIDYGFHPETEILIEQEDMFKKAFDLFSRDLKHDSPHARVLDEIVSLIVENRKRDSGFLWEPYSNIMSEVKRLHKQIAGYVAKLSSLDQNINISPLKHDIAEQARKITTAVAKAELTMDGRFRTDLDAIESGDFDSVMSHKLKTKIVNTPKSKGEKTAFERNGAAIEEASQSLNDLLRRYASYYSRVYFRPYVDALGLVQQSLDRIARQRGQVLLNDVNKMLAEHLVAEEVPDVYFKIGETIYHYLIDEFQDTSPIQWKNLHSLIEESLSKGGSLFVVGDTKQSIFGFRDADWRIMKQLETDPSVFPSAHHDLKSLGENYRSGERIVEFVRKVFHDIIPAAGYGNEATASGLSDFEQHSVRGSLNEGYVEVALIDQDESGSREQQKIIEIVQECHRRGYPYRNIAIITPSNAKVIAVSSWLNGNNIPFVSHSSLDIRRRKIIGEIISLLRFLDTPVDDLSLSTFLLGDLFSRALRGQINDGRLEAFLFDNARENTSPLYTKFRTDFQSLWNRYFEHLFNVAGYLPLYDLISEVYKIFDVFGLCPDEESSLAKLMEVIHNFEQTERNSVKDFLIYSDDEGDDSEWEMSIPGKLDAIQVMTIHKSKGLGFPVVIVLLYNHIVQTSGRIIYEKDGSLQLLKTDDGIREKSSELQQMHNEQKFRNTVDEFNKLYVAFTRAERELYALGVYKGQAKEPVSFLPSTGYEPGSKPPAASESFEPGLIAVPFHHTAPSVWPVHNDKKIGKQETLRGDFLHRALSKITILEEDYSAQLETAIRDASAETDETQPMQELKIALERFIIESGIKPLFERKAGRQIFTEFEFSNVTGKLFRADRIVVDTDAVAVVDFKTGTDSEENDYRKQVNNYIDVIRTFFPGRKASGIIGYIDLRTIVAV